MKIEYTAGDVDLIAGGALALLAVGFRPRIELVGEWFIVPQGGEIEARQRVTFDAPMAAELLDDNTLEILFMGQVAAALVPAVSNATHAATITLLPQSSKLRQPLLVTQ